MNLDGWIGKKVYIILKNRRIYSGKVISSEEKQGFSWITIIDRFNKKIIIASTEIDVLQEEE